MGEPSAARPSNLEAGTPNITSGDTTPTLIDNANQPDALLASKADIEHLGRQRPPTLPSLPVEVGFIISVVLSMMLSEFFVSGFNIALPDVATELHMDESAQTWPAGAINLTTSALLLPFARLCDMYGGRVVFLGGQVWLMAWSLGIGGAAFLPAGLSLLGQTYRPGPRKNLMFSLYGAFAVIGFYSGIFVAAIAVQFLNWRWFFWIGAIIIFVVVVVSFLTVPRNLGVGYEGAAMDWWGLFTIVPGLVLVVFAFTEGGHAPQGWRTPYVYVTLIVGVLMLGVAGYVEGWVAEQPLLPMELFAPKYMRRLVLALFLSYGCFGLYLFYASFYIENVLHTTPIQSAAWFTPMAVGGMVLAITGGFVLHLLPGRILLIIACLGYLTCTLLFANMPEQTTDASGTKSPSTNFLYWAYVFPAMIGTTVGVDITFNVTNVFITTSVPSRLQGAAGALINSVLYLGIAFWLGIGETIVSATVESQGEMSLREQYQIGFWTAVALGGIALCLMVTVRIGEAAAEMTADEKAELARRAVAEGLVSDGDGLDGGESEGEREGGRERGREGEREREVEGVAKGGT